MDAFSEPTAACGGDPRVCFHYGWRAHRRSDGARVIRCRCPRLTLEVVADGDRFTWTMTRLDVFGCAAGQESGEAGRLLRAARELATAVQRIGAAADLRRDEIAVGVLLAERREQRGPACRCTGVPVDA